jgi:hypothetical protein
MPMPKIQNRVKEQIELLDQRDMHDVPQKGEVVRPHGTIGRLER